MDSNKKISDDNLEEVAGGNKNFKVQNNSLVPLGTDIKMCVNGKNWTVREKNGKLMWYTDCWGGQWAHALPLNSNGEPYDPFGTSSSHT